MKYTIDDNGCWNFNGCKTKDGYGRVKRGGVNYMAHRYALSVHLGRPIGEGLVVMHSCDNPSCVNPEHLSEGTQADNIRDCIEKGRGNRSGSNHSVKPKVSPHERRLMVIRKRALQGWAIPAIAKYHKWDAKWIRMVMQTNGIKIHSK